MSDIWEDPDTKRWIKHVRESLVPKLTESQANVTLYSGKMDVKLAVELGCTILLDKPIVLVVKPGTVVPDHLVRVADRIIEMGPHTASELARFLKEMTSNAAD